jgi:arylsulfatase
MSISRRRFLEASAAAAVTAAVGSRRAGAKTPALKPPNILFLMDDQHRGDALGVAGNTVVATPNLDRLAREGAYFPKAHASVPSCVAARASILTGKSPWGHGLLGYADQARKWSFEKPQSLHDAGYYAMSIGKNHFTPMRNHHGYDKTLLYDGLPESDKVDDYGLWLSKTAPAVDEHSTGLGWNDRGGKPWPHADELHPTHWTGQEAVDFLSRYQNEKPFFLKVSFHRPHSPFDPISKWFDYYGKVELPKAQVGQWAQAWYGKFTPPQKPSAPRAALSDEEIRNSRQGYYGSISHVDEQIGRIVEVLRKRGMLENTLIVFVSDHGEMVGDQHLWRKAWAYEGSSRIPMIVRWGSEMLDAPRGQVLPQLTELRDVLPTFLDAAGEPIPAVVEGKSLLDLVRGKTNGWRTQLDLEHSACYFKENQWTALTDGRFKYIYHAYNGKQQLFDLENDPAELSDLSADAAGAQDLQSWRGRMIEHLAVRGPLWVKNDDLALRRKPMPYGANFPDKTGNTLTGH